MKFIDMHCDTLTVCADNNDDIAVCGLQTNLQSLIKSGYAAQCFAIFTEGATAELDFERYLAFYQNALSAHGDIAAPVLNYADLERCWREGRLGCILTVENLSFTGGDISRLARLKSAGVKMVSLVWNNANAFAYPNLIMENGLPRFEKREGRGLTALGRAAAERLDELKIIIDISHLSDGGALELLDGRKIPLVASHSNAEGECAVSRNLTDGLIKKIAACGGVVGVNYCADFLGGEAFESVLRHVNYLIKVGGEDLVALGSDFDGIPQVENLETCARVPALFNYLHDNGIPHKILEKLAYKNFLRVFSHFG